MDRYPFDAEYLRRLREGDPMTVDHFDTYFREKLAIKLSRRGFAKSRRDDIIQETFARFFEKLRVPDAIRSPESLGAFVFRICDLVVLEGYRDPRYEPIEDNGDVPIPGPSVEDVLVKREEAEVVRRTLTLLTAKEREIILDIFVRKPPKDEICAKNHCTRNYLRVVLHRAVARFRFLYSKEKGKPPRSGH
ncbi:MAG TPA: sigma-70 family RNA polymerase sigma factor [Thermoanaerobaculia bacterium]